MKKFLYATIAFFLFSISVSILQTSCDKDAEASPEGNTDVSQINKIFYVKLPKSNNWDLPMEIWTANYDGSGQAKINISLPGGYHIGHGGPNVSPDGKKLFFQGANTNTSSLCIFSCNLDGSNVIKIIELADAGEMSLGGAY